MVRTAGSQRQVHLRVTLRYVGRSGFPVTVGWPLARLEICEDVVSVTVPRFLPLGSIAGPANRTLPRDKITKIERTQYGVRRQSVDSEDPWVIASVFPKHLLRRLAENGIVPDGPIVPGSWGKV